MISLADRIGQLLAGVAGDEAALPRLHGRQVGGPPQGWPAAMPLLARRSLD
jgi:hypothetical protein